MMHRIDPSRLLSRPKHDASQTALLNVIAELRQTLEANEPIGVVQREGTLSILSTAREDIERCRSRLNRMVMSVADETIMNHMEMLSWINALSLDLKLAQKGLHVEQYPLPITSARLDEGQRLVRALDSCRERARFD